MSAFAILLHDDPTAAEIRAKIKDTYPDPDRYEFSEHVYLITGPKLATEITAALGLDDNPELNAAILRLNGSYSGRSWLKLWDWMQAAASTTTAL